MQSLTVFCTRTGYKFGPDYVNRLYAMFARHLLLPYKFVCTTDDPLYLDPRIEVRPPARKCWGWWNLEEAYSDPPWAEGGAVLYTGLDTVIHGDITAVIEERLQADRLTLMRDFSEICPARTVPQERFVGSWADGVAFVPRGGVPIIWERFLKEVGPASHYEMHLFNTQVLREARIVPDMWQDVHPGFLCSFKWPEYKLERPDEPVVCFHGKPSVRNAADAVPWIKEAWTTEC